MKAEHTDAVWLTEDHEFTLAELADLSGMSEAELRDLVDYGAVTPVNPVNPDSSTWVFDGTCLLTARTACRLRISFDLEPHGVALIVSLLNRIHELETEACGLRAQLPRPVH